MHFIKLFEQFHNENTIFPNSKVVDSNGNLLEVYHGSPNIFDSFKSFTKDKKQFGQNDTWNESGIFFTDDYETAVEYSVDSSEMSDWGTKQTKHEDSLTEQGKDEEWMDEISKYETEDYFKKGEVYKANLNIENPLIVEGENRLWSDINKDIFNQDLSMYDGIIIKNVKEMKNIQTTYVVFEPEQIKVIK